MSSMLPYELRSGIKKKEDNEKNERYLTPQRFLPLLPTNLVEIQQNNNLI